ncbi:MAG: PIN domain-containing protein [Solirubrobacterales bacterium]
MLAVERVLRASHVHAATEPINGPDEYGAFPSAWRPGPLDQRVPPVVVDANVLRNDLRYACENDRRTVLVTAANSGAIRLFAASHVLDELVEYAELWALESDGVTPDQLKARWRSEYLPLIRVIEDRDLPRHLLDAAEVARVRTLEQADPDDIPSVTLALAIEAFYLSEDGPALRAVYGEEVDRSVHHAWLQCLMAGGDVGQLGKLIFSAGALPMAAGAGLLAGARRIADRFSPWVLAALGIGLAGVLWARPPSTATRQKIGDAAVEFGFGLIYAYSRYQAAYSDFARMTPDVPGPEQLAASNRGAAWTRLAMHHLARAPHGQMSAAELTEALPRAQIKESEAFVEIALRAGCFKESSPARWQLGASALPVTCLRRSRADVGLLQETTPTAALSAR